MRQIMSWQFKELFSSKKEKLIRFLISELIFLDNCIKLTQERKQKRMIKIAYKKIENILEANQKNLEEILTEIDYEKEMLVVFDIIKDIVNKVA